MKKKWFLSLLVILTVFLSGCTDSEDPVKSDTAITTTTTIEVKDLVLQIGESAKNSELEVTVISAEKTTSYQWESDYMDYISTETAGSGEQFILVDVEIKNIGSERAYVSTSEFSVSDSEGYRYDTEVYLGKDGLDVFKELYENQKVKGKIVFEVPDTASGLMLQYDFGNIFGDAQLVSWEIK